MVNQEFGRWNGHGAGFILFQLWLNPFHKIKKEKRDDMSKRFVTIWFRHLRTDWFTLRQPALCHVPFVLASPDHGRMIITAANSLAQTQGVDMGMSLADARAIIPSLQ